MLNNKNLQLRYCTGVSNIDFYPFSEIKNWKNLGYLLLVLKPYIDKENNLEGILENYIFSEEENTLEATVSLKATWQDGTPISSFEAAIGIAKGFKYREISTNIRVIGTENINELGWEKKNYKGIEILSPIKFKLHFEKNIENMKGVLEDALSFTSAENIIWPARLNSLLNYENNLNKFDIISKYPIQIEDGNYFINALGYQVELCTSDNENACDFYFNSSDFKKYKLPSELKSNFIINQSKNLQTLIAIFNSNSKNFLSREARYNLTCLLRNIASSLQETENIYVSPGHFDYLEPGSHPEIKWSSDMQIIPKSIQEIKIAIPYPFSDKIFDSFEKYLLKNGVNVKWIYIAEDEEEALNADVHIFIDRIQNNRQIWLQNLLKSKFIVNNIKNFQKTFKSIQNITIKSASTLPLNTEALIKFEQAAFDEVSISPIFRYHLYSYTRKYSPIVLNIAENKELYFSLNKI